MLQRKKIIGLVVTLVVLVTIFASHAYASTVYVSPAKKSLEAFYGTVKIIVNGEDVTKKIEPFVVEGTTYIPLRVVANTFNKNVSWNESTYTATITDDLTQIDGYYQTEIIKRDIEISNLQNRIKQLEKNTKDDKDVTLSDLEKTLNKEFGEYRNIDFDISLSGSTSKLNVRIDVDLYDYKSRWNSLSTSQKTSYIQDIVDEILDTYDEPSIKGSVRDTDERKTILEFTTTNRGVVKIDKEYSGSRDISRLERTLDKDYNDYFRDIDLRITLEGDEDDITFYVNLNSNKDGKAWDKLSDSEVKRFMLNIYNDIEDELEYANIEGYVYDTYHHEDLASYYKTKSGSERFNRL